jgi:site-specific recombinase XerD
MREDLRIIQEALGHASIATTTMYVHMATPRRLAELTRFLE